MTGALLYQPQRGESPGPEFLRPDDVSDSLGRKAVVEVEY